MSHCMSLHGRGLPCGEARGRNIPTQARMMSLQSCKKCKVNVKMHSSQLSKKTRIEPQCTQISNPPSQLSKKTRTEPQCTQISNPPSQL